MPYDVDDIKAMVKEVEDARVDFVTNAEAAEKMWALQPFEDDPSTYVHQDGVEAIATADPYNVIQLFLRFVAGEPRIEVPYLSAEKADDERSQKIESWLMAYWAQMRRQQGRNLMQDGAWYSGVRGRGAMDIQWIGFDVPELRANSIAPIETRLLDPLNTGFAYGPYGVDYAYHKYRETRRYVEKAYPKFEFKDRGRARPGYDSKKNVTVISMWIAERDAIYHCVLVNDEFAKPPTKTKYKYVPMIEWMGDGAPIADEAARSLSLLHGMKDTWPAKSRLISKIATGLNFYFYPIYKAHSPNGKSFRSPITIKPGATLELDDDQDVVPMATDVNVPLAQAMLQLLDTQIQQSTFPTVMYGEEGGASSGYAINQLASSARGRMNTIRINWESAIERANQIILSLVEVFGDEEGVTLLAAGREPGDRGAPITLSAKDIRGNYNNTVTLVPEIPTDETQRLMTWDQLVEHGRVSNQFYRDRIINLPTPRDEDLRVSLEQAVKNDPDLQKKMWLAAIREVYKDKDQWRRVIAGTAYQQLNDAEEQWVQQEEARKAQAKQARAQAKQDEEQDAAMQEYLASGTPPKGWHAMPDGSLMRDGEMNGQRTPPLMPPGMPMDLGMPPGLPTNAALPGVLSGMPAPGPLPQSGPMMPPGPPQGGLPPGVPQEMGAGLTPEMLGVPPQGGMPGQFQAMQGQPLTDEELQRRLMGPGAGGPPPMR